MMNISYYRDLRLMEDSTIRIINELLLDNCDLLPEAKTRFLIKNEVSEWLYTDDSPTETNADLLNCCTRTIIHQQFDFHITAAAKNNQTNITGNYVYGGIPVYLFDGQITGVVFISGFTDKPCNTESVKRFTTLAKHICQLILTRITTLLTLNRKNFHLHNSPFAIVEWVPGGIIKSWEGQSEKIFGWSKNEVIGKSFFELDFVYGDDREMLSTAFNKIINTQIEYQVSYNRNYTKDGRVLYCKWHNSALKDEDGNVVSLMAYGEDVTELKKKEEKLQFEQSQSLALINNIDEVIYSVDKDLRLITANNAYFTNAEKALGKPRKIGDKVLEGNHMGDELLKKMKQCFSRGLAGENVKEEVVFPTQFLNREFCAQITWNPIFTNEEVTGVAVCMADITANKELINKLIKKESELVFAQKNTAALINNTNEIIYSIDTDFRILSANTTFEKVTTQLFGKPKRVGEYILQGENLETGIFAHLYQHYQSAFAGERFSEEIHFPSSFLGAESWGNVVFNPIVDEGVITGCAVWMTDITARKRIEQELTFQQENTAALINNTSDIIFSVDTSLHLLSANTTFYYATKTIYGIAIKIGDMVLNANEMPAATYNTFRELYNRVLNGESFTEELLVPVSITGNEYWLEITFNPIHKGNQIKGAAVCMRDINSRKKVEKILKEKTELLEDVLEHLGEGFLLINANFTIAFANHQAAKIAGIKPEEFIGKSIRQLFPVVDKRLSYKNLELAFKEQKNIFIEEFSESIQSWEEIAIYPSADHISVFIRNITERKMQQISIEDYQQKLDAFFNSANDIIILISPDLKVLAYNKLLKDFISEFLQKDIEAGDHVLEYLPIIIHEKFIKNFNIALGGESVEETVFTPFKGEKHSWWNGKFLPMKNQQGNIIGVAFTDTNVTEAKKREQALIEYEQKLAAFFNSASDIIVLIATDMSILAFNSMAKRFVQNFLHKQPLEGDSILNYLYPPAIEKFKTAFHIALSGKDFEEEMYTPFDNEKYNWWHSKFSPMKNAQGEIIGVVFTDTNITEKKHIELELLKSEQTFSSLVHNSPGVVFRFHVKKDKSFYFSYISHRMREVFDLDLPLNTPNCFDRMTFINKEKFFNSITLCVQDLSNWEYEGQLMGDNGSIKWFNGKATPVIQEDEVVFIGILLDINAQKQAELEDQLMYNLLINFNEADSLEEALTGLIAAVTAHFNFNYAEAWSLSIDNTSLMLKAEYPLRKDYFSFKQDQLEKKLNTKGLGLPGAAWEKKEMIYWKDLQNAPLVQKEMVKAAGFSSAIALPVFFKNEVIAILTFFADKPFTSTQLSGSFWFKLSMEMGNSIQKKKTEEELDNFFNLAPNFLAIAGFDGYFKKLNPSFTRLLGYSNEELLSIPFIEFVHPDDWENTKKILSELIQGESINELELRFITKSGQLKWLSWSCIGLAGENVIYAAAKEITEGKELEVQRNQVMEELKTNNEDLKQFSYVTSHNLRAPLTNLLAMVQLINLENITHERTKKLVAGFRISTNQLNETLSDLINILVIKDAKNKEALSLIGFNEIYNRVHLLLKQSIEETYTTIEANFTEIEFVKFNGFFMESIMHHLMTNAIKFASPNRKPLIKIYTRLHMGAVQLIVNDNGLGIDMKYAKERIFGLHQRFHVHKEGRGFGLHLIHSQITALGGKINVESEVDKGTTFTITFKKQL